MLLRFTVLLSFALYACAFSINDEVLAQVDLHQSNKWKHAKIRSISQSDGVVEVQLKQNSKTYMGTVDTLTLVPFPSHEYRQNQEYKKDEVVFAFVSTSWLPAKIVKVHEPSKHHLSKKKYDVLLEDNSMKTQYTAINLCPNTLPLTRFFHGVSTGDRVEVYFPEEKMWFAGSIDQISSEGPIVAFDDGDFLYLPFSDDGQWRKIKPQALSTLHNQQRLRVYTSALKTWSIGTLITNTHSGGVMIKYDDTTISEALDQNQKFQIFENPLAEKTLGLSIGDRISGTFTSKKMQYASVDSFEFDAAGQRTVKYVIDGTSLEEKHTLQFDSSQELQQHQHTQQQQHWERRSLQTFEQRKGPSIFLGDLQSIKGRRTDVVARVRVYWPEYHQWFQGKLYLKTGVVKYDDGQEDRISTIEKFQLLPDDRGLLLSENEEVSLKRTSIPPSDARSSVISEAPSPVQSPEAPSPVRSSEALSSISSSESSSSDDEATSKVSEEECSKCSICLDSITNPLTLVSCSHTFCKECVRRFYHSKREDVVETRLGIRVPCPNCRKESLLTKASLIDDNDDGDLSINDSQQEQEEPTEDIEEEEEEEEVEEDAMPEQAVLNNDQVSEQPVTQERQVTSDAAQSLSTSKKRIWSDKEIKVIERVIENFDFESVNYCNLYLDALVSAYLETFGTQDRSDYAIKEKCMRIMARRIGLTKPKRKRQGQRLSSQNLVHSLTSGDVVDAFTLETGKADTQTTSQRRKRRKRTHSSGQTNTAPVKMRLRGRRRSYVEAPDDEYFSELLTTDGADHGNSFEADQTMTEESNGEENPLGKMNELVGTLRKAIDEDEATVTLAQAALDADRATDDDLLTKANTAGLHTLIDAMASKEEQVEPSTPVPPGAVPPVPPVPLVQDHLAILQNAQAAPSLTKTNAAGRNTLIDAMTRKEEHVEPSTQDHVAILEKLLTTSGQLNPNKRKIESTSSLLDNKRRQLDRNRRQQESDGRQLERNGRDQLQGNIRRLDTIDLTISSGAPTEKTPVAVDSSTRSSTVTDISPSIANSAPPATAGTRPTRNIDHKLMPQQNALPGARVRENSRPANRLQQQKQYFTQEYINRVSAQTGGVNIRRFVLALLRTSFMTQEYMFQATMAFQQAGVFRKENNPYQWILQNDMRLRKTFGNSEKAYETFVRSILPKQAEWLNKIQQAKAGYNFSLIRPVVPTERPSSPVQLREDSGEQSTVPETQPEGTDGAPSATSMVSPSYRQRHPLESEFGWTPKESRIFLQSARAGMRFYQDIAKAIGTRSAKEVRSYAKAYKENVINRKTQQTLSWTDKESRIFLQSARAGMSYRDTAKAIGTRS
eukprot:g3591.t1